MLLLLLRLGVYTGQVRLGLVTTQLDRCRMDLEGVREVRWELESGNYTLFYGEGNANRRLGTWIFVHRRISLAVKKVEFISDRVPCITLKGRRYDIIVLNEHASTEDKDDDIKDILYDEIKRLFDQLPMHHMKILLGDFNAKVRRENIFQPTIGTESVHPESIIMVLDFFL